MTGAEADEWTSLIDGLRRGDPEVAARFYSRYAPLLERLADRNLEPGIRRRVGGDEVAHSACRTFLRRIHGGEFALDGDDQLWSLLCAITLAKLKKKARFHLAAKRGVRDERNLAPTTAGESAAMEPVSDGVGPAAAAEFADVFEHLLSGLDEEGRQLVCMKLEQRTDEEVADALECSERTVRRLRKRVQERLAAVLEDA